MIGTEAAPVLTFINSTNLIVQVPVDATLGPTTLTATYKGQSSTAFNIKLGGVGAGNRRDSKRRTAALSTTHPTIPSRRRIRPLRVLRVYALAIGLGTTNPAQVTDSIATAQAPTTQQVQVMVGSKMVAASLCRTYLWAARRDTTRLPSPFP